MQANFRGLSNRVKPRRAIIAFFMYLCSTGCDGLTRNDATGPTTSRSAMASLFLGNLAAQSRSLEDPLLALAREAPGFGGLYQDSETRQYVATSAIETNDVQIRNMAGQYFGVAPTRVEIVRVQYTYAQLNSWRREIASGAPGSLALLGISSRMNKVRVGVRGADDVQRVEVLMEQLGIPNDAVDLTVEPPIILNQSLSSRYRPLAAGFRAYVETMPGSCTLTGSFCEYDWVEEEFDYEGFQYFMVPTHCTPAFGSVSSVRLFQATSPDTIGIEFMDPPFTNTLAACQEYKDSVCRYSDAALFISTIPKDSVVYSGLAWRTPTA